MYVITVYPIIKGTFKQELTYWSAQAIPLGSIIEVPLRGRNIHALVGEAHEASEVKSQIKNASFSTRKIEKPKPVEKIPRACVEACISLSQTYAVPLGSILKSCIPDTAFLYEPKNTYVPAEKHTQVRTAVDILLYQTNLEDRLSTYKSIVREEFARKKSILIVAPTTVSAVELYNSLRRGVDDYAFCVHGRLTKKKQLDTWKLAIETEHSVLVITTPLFSCIPRTDFSTVIVEKESSRAYIQMRAPFIDCRDYIEYYAKALGARLIFGDSILRVETLHRRETGEVVDFFPVSFRIDKNASVTIIDTHKTEEGKNFQDSSSKGRKGFNILSPELLAQIEHIEKRNEHLFIFASRRGLSPQTVCGDCGQSVTCEVCESPVVLHQSKTPGTDSTAPNRYFLCHHCGRQRSALEACKTCTSWKLVTLGVAIDNTAMEIKKHFPGITVFTLDKDSASTDKQAEEITKRFEETKGSILLGTESALAFLPEVKYSAIASIDSLLSIPDFKIHERIMQILLRILEKTTDKMYIQTRAKNQTILTQFASGNLLDFYRKEIQVRQLLAYPPFTQHIKITIEDTRALATQKMKRLQDLLDTFEEKHTGSSMEHMIFPAFVPSAKGKSTLHLLITLPKETWKKGVVSDDLHALLMSLPREYEVRVNPQSLL
jgi:primosomal protein N' (replication factor Y) (superfamily II helicase)